MLESFMAAVNHDWQRAAHFVGLLGNLALTAGFVAVRLVAVLTGAAFAVELLAKTAARLLFLVRERRFRAKPKPKAAPPAPESSASPGPTSWTSN